MSDEVVIELDEHGVLLATFNRPEQMNALNAGLGEGLLAAIDRASRDDDVRALVLTGNGRAFCAGAEITAASDPSRGASGPVPRHARLDHFGGSGRTAEAFANCDVPVIAAINGATAGAGFGIAVCCDLRFVAQSARLGRSSSSAASPPTTARPTGCPGSSAPGAPSRSCTTAT